MSLSVALGIVAVVFVVVCGINDGGALLAQVVRLPAGSPLAAGGLLAAAVVAGPLLFGTSVARTFTDGVAAGHDPRGGLVFLAGTSACVLVVWTLTWYGVPTSVTLAVLGGLAGAGLGLGVPPDRAVLARVLVIGLLAPAAGTLLGYGLARAARRIGVLTRPPRPVRLAIYAGQCLAYAVNDGQKMYAVCGVAWAALAGRPGETGWPPPLVPAACVLVLFGVGALLASRRLARAASVRVSRPRAWQLTSAQAASALAVVGSAALHAPVSMTQAMAGGLVGTGISEGVRRVRWQHARPLVLSWGVTLPASLAVGLAAGVVLAEVPLR